MNHNIIQTVLATVRDYPPEQALHLLCEKNLISCQYDHGIIEGQDMWRSSCVVTMDDFFCIKASEEGSTLCTSRALCDSDAVLCLVDTITAVTIHEALVKRTWPHTSRLDHTRPRHSRKQPTKPNTCLSQLLSLEHDTSVQTLRRRQQDPESHGTLHALDIQMSHERGVRGGPVLLQIGVAKQKSNGSVYATNIIVQDRHDAVDEISRHLRSFPGGRTHFLSTDEATRLLRDTIGAAMHETRSCIVGRNLEKSLLSMQALEVDLPTENTCDVAIAKQYMDEFTGHVEDERYARLVASSNAGQNAILAMEIFLKMESAGRQTRGSLL